jgi:hypothetical protein
MKRFLAVSLPADQQNQQTENRERDESHEIMIRISLARVVGIRTDDRLLAELPDVSKTE